jgi:hypothetical protein
VQTNLANISKTGFPDSWDVTIFGQMENSIFCGLTCSLLYVFFLRTCNADLLLITLDYYPLILGGLQK